MIIPEKIFKIKPFSLNKEKKCLFFLKLLKKITLFHHDNCKEYQKGLDLSPNKINRINKIFKLPFLPITIFKKLHLISSKSLNGKIYNSSGTTGVQKSKIFLDKQNIINQSKALNSIGKNFLGNQKKPIVFIDSKENIFSNNNHSARAAAVLGFSIFASEKYFLLDRNFELDLNQLELIHKKYKNKSIIFFGFTSIIWEKFVKNLKNSKYKFKNSILLHGGGWKKIKQKNISEKHFESIIQKKLLISNIINYYGMIEQAGSIFFQCEYKFFHTSIFSDIFIRDKNFKILDNNEAGLVQLLSLLPTSYPGNNLITEDLGKIIGEDDCECGRLGKYFTIIGRAPKTELRGCSDV